MKNRDWERVSRRQPCRICKATSRCAFTLDGRVAKCCHALDGGVGHGFDDVGDYALYFNDTIPGAVRRAFEPHPASPIASTTTRHAVYSQLLALAGLSSEHAHDLARRGLDPADMAEAGYATLPRHGRERAALLAGLRAAFPEGLPVDVPGLHQGRLPDFDGTLIPVRDADGQILALKIRRDRGEPKYLWLSSKSQGGASSGSLAHAPLGARNRLDTAGARVVRLTEGPLKADVATALGGVVTLAIPGAMAARTALPLLAALDAHVVRLAWDADARTNPHVAGGLENAAHLFARELPQVALEVETWAVDPVSQSPKGIDDALAVGATIEAHRGARAWRELVQILHDAGRAPRPETYAAAGMGAEEDAAADSGHLAHEPSLSDLHGSGGGDGLDGADADAAPEPPAPRRRSFDRGDAVEIAHAMLEDLAVGSPHPIVHDRGTFWRYDSDQGVFLELTRDAVYNAVSHYAGCWSGTNKPKPLALNDNGIKGTINAAAHFAARPGFFDSARRGVCFADCFVTAEGGEVKCLGHSPDHRAVHALPVRYEMDADRGRWIAMLKEVFRRQGEDGSLDHEDTEACICLLQEFIGACLMGLSTALAACLILVGHGNDGKSKVLGVLRALFPKSSLCALPPQDWGRGFRLAELAGKRLNVVSELPERDILDAERFKAVVAGDPLTAERKYADPFLMTPEAGHLFAANALPPTKDQSKGFWRRFKVIPCMRQFGPDEEVRDYDKLVIAEELAGVAAWAMDGAARVQAQQRYTAPASAEEAHAEWRHDTDQVRQWKAECCTDDAASEDGIEVLYAAYRVWCGETGHPQLARNTFGARLKNLGLERRTKLARFYRVALRPRWRAAAHSCNERRN